MLETLRGAFRIPDLRRRILFTLAMLVVFRLAAHIPVPGVNRAAISQLISGGTLFGFLDLISGGALKNFTVVAMGIMPYINASIIIQLLTVVFPALEKLAKEGEEGRRKMTQYTRYSTVALALIQAVGTSVGLRGYIYDYSVWSVLLIALTLTSGTIFVMWLGEMITDRGIGNGISLLIFFGIVARYPSYLGEAYKYLTAGTLSFFVFIIVAVVVVAVIGLVVLITEGERRLPVQYAKRVVGRKVYGGQSTHLPIKVNQAGVMPIIFASSILAMPATVAQFNPAAGWALWVNRYFGFSSLFYLVAYPLLILFFTFFYTAITYNPSEISDNIKKYGGFIPGFRPGRPTTDYLSRVITRLTFPGALFLAFIAMLPYLIAYISKVSSWQFGGTSLLIVVGVALETMKQIEAQMMMRHYQGFMK